MKTARRELTNCPAERPLSFSLELVEDSRVNSMMMIGLTLLSAGGCGLMAGVFFAFSSFVMRASGRL
ncbi:MAG: hypothetical protein U1G07_21830 [Verrucomicrobiota bacterium]